MIKTFEPRDASEIAPAQDFLQKQVLEIEKALGQVAARSATPSQITQPLDALDRGRELVNDMHRQVRVRPLEAAIEAQLEWLDRAEANLRQSDGEPKVKYSKIELDRRILKELLEKWRSRPR